MSLLVVEGLDGTGKTTLSRSLAEHLGATWTATPGPRWGALRPSPEEEARYPEAVQAFYAMTVLWTSSAVRAELADGATVVIDRYWASARSYAGLRHRSVDLDALEDRLVPADVTVFVDLPEAIRIARLEARGMTAADRETLPPLRAEVLRSLYRQALARPVCGRVVEVSGLDAPANVLAAALDGILGRQVRRFG